MFTVSLIKEELRKRGLHVAEGLEAGMARHLTAQAQRWKARNDQQVGLPVHARWGIRPDRCLLTLT